MGFGNKNVYKFGYKLNKITRNLENKK